MAIIGELLDVLRVRIDRKYPQLLRHLRKAKVIAKALAEGHHVGISVYVSEGYRKEYKALVEVRQSKRSTRRWSYIPGNIPIGYYIAILRRND